MNGLSVTSSPSSSSSEDFEHTSESDRLRKKNISDVLSQIQLELDTLKLSVESERNATTQFPPGTVSALIRDIYDAQKEWQNAMLARQEMQDKRQNQLQDDENLIFGGNNSKARVLDMVGTASTSNSLERLRCERDSLIEVLASTKDRLNSIQVTYSLHKALLSDILGGHVVSNGVALTAPSTMDTEESTKLGSSSSSSSSTVDNNPMNIFLEGDPQERRRRWSFDEDDLRKKLALETKARKEAEEKCLRLERLVGILRRKLRCRHSS